MAALSTKSAAEDLMEFHLKTKGYGYEREVAFHAKRKWRVDFIIKAVVERFRTRGPLAIEVEGVTRFGSHLGRHQTARGMETDAHKYAELLLAGYPLLRVTQQMVKDGTAIAYVNRYFGRG